MDVAEIAVGLWRWTGWRETIGADVACVYQEGPDGVVLIDPLIPPEDEARFLEALDRDVARAGRDGVHVLLTVNRHERSSAALVARYGGIAWQSHEAPPNGIDVVDTGEGEVAFWLPEHRCLVCGDVLRRDGVRLVAAGPSLAFAAKILSLRVERLLLGHGAPVLEDADYALHEVLSPLLRG